MDQTIPNPKLYNVPFLAEEFKGMPYRKLGRSGLRVSDAGLGLWKIGYPETGDGARTDEKTSFQIFDRAIELGATFWDTANRYNFGSGNSERVIGRWFKSNPDQRRNVVLATKVYGGMDGWSPNHSHLSRLNIIESVKTCLARLQTDYIDLLYFHCPDPTTPAEESLATIEDLVQRDLVRYFAVSNITVDQLAVYQAIERGSSVRCRVLAVQNRFDIIRGEDAERAGVLAWCARTGTSFVAYSPLAQGLISDRYLEPQRAKAGDRLVDEKSLDKMAEAKALEKVRKLAALARQWGLETSQLALAYMLALPGMGPVIPSVSSAKQVESNAVGGKTKLTDDQKTAVKAIVG